MKSERPTEDQEPLRRVLRDWKIASPLPARFAAGVWRQIELAERDAAAGLAPAVWLGLKRWLGALVQRPGFAAAYVGLLLLAGLAGGYWQARLDAKSWDNALASRYVRAVDPFQRNGNK